MSTFRALLKRQKACGGNETRAWRADDSYLTSPHIFLKSVSSAERDLNLAHSWHTPGTLNAGNW